MKNISQRTVRKTIIGVFLIISTFFITDTSLLNKQVIKYYSKFTPTLLN